MIIKESSVGTDCALGFSTVTSNDVRMKQLLKMQSLYLHIVREMEAGKMKVYVAGHMCSAAILGKSLFSMSLCSSLVFCLIFLFYLMVGLNGKQSLLVDIYVTTSPQTPVSERALGKIITIINYAFFK